MKTINDIAKEAKVSTGTVDRVLHNRGGVSEKTAKRIIKIIKKHNFKINAIASSLALNKKLNIATLIPSSKDENVFWEAPLMGINKAQEEIEKLGIKIHNFSFNQFEAKSYLNSFKELLKTNPDGVLIAPSLRKETRTIINELEKNNIPYIFINTDLDEYNNISFVGQDSFASGQVAGKLMNLSLKENPSCAIIQLRSNIDNYQSIIDRIKGFKNYFTQNKIQLEFLTLSLTDLKNDKKIKQQLDSFLKKHPNTKGVFVPSSRISVIANNLSNNALKKMQLIGFDNTQQNIQCLEKDLISFLISQKPFNQGYEAIHLMVDYLVKGKNPIAKHYSPIDILTKENVRYNERNELLYENENTI